MPSQRELKREAIQLESKRRALEAEMALVTVQLEATTRERLSLRSHRASLLLSANTYHEISISPESHAARLRPGRNALEARSQLKGSCARANRAYGRQSGATSQLPVPVDFAVDAANDRKKGPNETENVDSQLAERKRQPATVSAFCTGRSSIAKKGGARTPFRIVRLQGAACNCYDAKQLHSKKPCKSSQKQDLLPTVMQPSERVEPNDSLCVRLLRGGSAVFCPQH